MKVAAGEGIAAAVEALERGELVAMPTETVYGLAADATNPAAVGRIYLAKGRPRFNPLIVHVASAAAAMRHVRFNADAEKLAEAFWPGPLTLVLPLRPDTGIADLVTAGLDTLAVRVPAHPVAQALLAASARPLAAPSANRSGHVSPTTAAHVVDDLGDKVSVILAAGATPVGLESTIVGLAGDMPVLLRAGGLARARIEAVLGRPLGAAAPAGDAPAAPGMLASHYAPAAHAAAGRDGGSRGGGAARLRARSSGRRRKGGRHGQSQPFGRSGGGRRQLLRRHSGNSTVGQARSPSMPIPDEGLGEAINDRLRRAAAPRD